MVATSRAIGDFFDDHFFAHLRAQNFSQMVLIGAFENGCGGIGHVKLRKRGHATWPLEWGHFFALRR